MAAAKASKKPVKSAKKSPAKKASAKKAPAKAAKKAPAKKAPAKVAAAPEPAQHGRRADYGSDVDSLIARLPAATQEIVGALRAIIRKAAPQATETVKWGVPVYSQNGLLCYISAKHAKIRFGFYDQGIHLTDPEGLLEGSGQNMRHVKIRSPQDVRPELFSRWVEEAVRLNQSR